MRAGAGAACAKGERCWPELQEARRALHHRVTHDGLTGLANRARLAAHADQHDGEAMAVLLIDLDGFKQVNDSLGHAAGDRLLQEVARRISATLRPDDLAGRLGGDEFLVLLPGGDATTAESTAARIRSAVEAPVRLGDEVAGVGASVGYAVRPPGSARSLDALTHEADVRMYAAKRDRHARR